MGLLGEWGGEEGGGDGRGREGGQGGRERGGDAGGKGTSVGGLFSEVIVVV